MVVTSAERDLTLKCVKDGGLFASPSILWRKTKEKTLIYFSVNVDMVRSEQIHFLSDKVDV